MPTAIFPQQRHARVGALLLTLAFHLLLLLMWRMQTIARPTPPGPAQRWLTLFIPPSPKPPQAIPLPPVRSQRPAPGAALPQHAPPAAVPAPPATSAPTAPVAGLDELMLAPAPAQHESQADAIRRQALRDIAQIDRDLRKASPSQIQAPVDTPATRLAAGIAQATRRPSLLEPARIEAITDQTEFKRRMYKVTTALGTYCVIYEATHRAAVDNMGSGSKPHITTCPREE